MNKTNIIVVDDEKLIREGLKIILSTYDDIGVVGVAGDGREALSLCKEKDVQVVLMDIRMPNCDGVLGTRIIKEQFPHIKILILTTFNDKEYIHEALKFGASGYLLKDSSIDTTIKLLDPYFEIKDLKSSDGVYYIKGKKKINTNTKEDEKRKEEINESTISSH